MAEEVTTTAAPDTTQAAPATTAPTTLMAGGTEAAPETTGAPDTTQTNTKDEIPEVPEKYEFTAPEGTTFDEEILGEFTTYAKEQKLPQAEAQKLLDLSHKAQTKMAEKMVETLVSQSKSDKEIGGENLNTSIEHARAFAKRYGGEGFDQLLNHPIIGNHPEFIRALARAGKDLGEGTFIPGGSAGASSNPERILYPSMNR